MNFKSADDEHEKWLQEPRSRLKMMVYNENNSNASNDYGMTPFVVAKIEKK